MPSHAPIGSIREGLTPPRARATIPSSWARVNWVGAKSEISCVIGPVCMGVDCYLKVLVILFVGETGKT